MKSILSLDSSSEKQICDSVVLIQSVLGSDLLGVYLSGSAVSGGLQRYSDIDLFVVTSRSTSLEEKKDLARGLLKLSGIYMKGELRPLEVTIVERSKINPWKYPPEFDFQYGEWLRDDFERGNFQPWSSKEMPDLAVLITQALLTGITLFGEDAKMSLPQIPYRDFILAIKDELSSLLFRLDGDERNVLLTLARIWRTMVTDEIVSKPEAADWAVERLSHEHYLPVLRAKNICVGSEGERWDDIADIAKESARFMLEEINTEVERALSDATLSRFIKVSKIG